MASGWRRPVRSWFVDAAMAGRVDLRGRRIIVTGAALGSIGFETAALLARWGADVVVTTRSDPTAIAAALNARIADEVQHGRIDAYPLDLADSSSVRTFSARILQNHGERLDVLINNAGIHLDLLSQWKQPRKAADGHEIHWRTNYLGTTQLSLCLLPLLRQTGRQFGDARIINVVSQLHSKGSNAGLFDTTTTYNSWVAYSNSKLALMHASFELQRRHAANDHLQTYCLHPGAVFSNIADRGLAGNPWIEKLRKTFAPIEAWFLLTPAEGAQISVHCATSADAIGGHYYRDCAIARASTDSADSQVSARLLTHTEQWAEQQNVSH